MYTPDSQPPQADDLDIRFFMRFADPGYERRFGDHYVAFYFRYAQVSLLLGVILIGGDFLVDLLAHSALANFLRLLVAIPVLLVGLGYSLLPNARRHWQPVMASFIVVVSFCLFVILLRIDLEGGAGLTTWVGVLNFTFLEFYCFVILGVQFRHALVSGLIILTAFEYALVLLTGLPLSQAIYWSYHVVTVFILAVGLGWWREYLLRKEFLARTALDDARAIAEERATRLAHYDEVTGLPNRRMFAQLALPTLERSRQSGLGCAVLHVEIDRLGSVRDAFGRARGDTVMAELTQRIRASVRAGDLAAVTQAGNQPGLVASLGDSGFSILVATLESQQRASQVARRFLAAIAEPLLVDGQSMVITASVGIAMFPGDAEDMTDLTRCAEQAARAAASAGGAQYRFFDEQLNARTRDRVVLETELRLGIEAGQLWLQYQPKVDVNHGNLVGAEALVRWRHPTRGVLNPQSFIALAEESGLIVPLTNWVLDAAVDSQRRWADQGLRTVPISVNLTASSFVDERLPDQLDELMLRYGLAPSCLVLELTETMLMRDVGSAMNVLGLLRSRGFGISLDDFGTGYSSLSYLERLPVSELKIDQSFVIDVARGGRDGAVATAIITLGRELGLRVVAEGVETEEQSRFLVDRGCVIHQGFLYSRAIDRDEFGLWLKADKAEG